MRLAPVRSTSQNSGTPTYPSPFRQPHPHSSISHMPHAPGNGTPQHLMEFGMQRCTHCQQLVPAEALLCTYCDAYLGTATAIAGQPNTLHLPTAAPAPAPRDPFAKAQWHQPAPTPPAKRIELPHLVWFNSRGGSRQCRVRIKTTDYVLYSTSTHWSVHKMVQHKHFRAEVQLVRSYCTTTDSGQDLCRQYLVNHLSQERCTTPPPKYPCGRI
jgi:hypothetical protein